MKSLQDTTALLVEARYYGLQSLAAHLLSTIKTSNTPLMKGIETTTSEIRKSSIEGKVHLQLRLGVVVYEGEIERKLFGSNQKIDLLKARFLAHQFCIVSFTADFVNIMIHNPASNSTVEKYYLVLSSLT